MQHGYICMSELFIHYFALPAILLGTNFENLWKYFEFKKLVGRQRL